MPISVEVMELVQLLDEEGFGPLAGELLTQISLGREIDNEEPDTGGPMDSKLAAALADAPPPREPIPEHQQLAVAAEFLRLRLVEPVRRLAEAERIAGLLLRKSRETQNVSESGFEARTEESDPVRIQFSRPSEDERPPLERTEREGRAKTADELAKLLEQLDRASG